MVLPCVDPCEMHAVYGKIIVYTGEKSMSVWCIDGFRELRVEVEFV